MICWLGDTVSAASWRGYGDPKDVDTEKLSRLWRDGLPIAEIACELGLTYKRVQLLARRLGLRKRTQADSAKGKRRNVNPSEEDIKRACEEIRSTWSELEKCERKGGYLDR